MNLTLGARRNVPPTAHLRVFSPLRAFDDTDQLLIREQRQQAREAFESRAEQAKLTRIARPVTDPFPHETTERYRMLRFETEDGISTLFCPDQLPLRAGMAAALLEDQVPFTLLDTVIPVAAAEAHSERLQEHGMWLDDEPLFTRTSTWGIPMAWFSALREDDHESVEERDGLVTSVRLSAPLMLAIERTAQVANVLARTAEELPLLGEVAEIHDWLLRFHRESVVELDYGTLAEHVWPDDSPRDLREGIQALEDGDYVGAAAAHRRLSRRWSAVQALGHAS